MRSSSFSRDGLRVALRGIWFVATGMALFVTSASAVDPNRAMSQYVRDRWTSEHGFPSGAVHAIAQTRDGYLWIASESGLVRFDGFSFRKIAVPDALPMASILGLAVDAEGLLWVRLAGPTLLRYKDGAFEDATLKLGMHYSNVTALGNSSKGALVIGRLEPGTVTYDRGRFATVQAATPLARSPVISVLQGPNGDIWMGTRDAGLYRATEKRVVAVGDGLPDTKINFLLADGRERVWIATDNGIALWNGSAIVEPDPAGGLRGFQALAMVKDRDSNVWIGTDSRGLVRVNSGGISALPADGHELRESITALFEDREGNIWIGRANSIERLRDTAFVTYSRSEGLPSEGSMPLFADSDGRVWFAPANGGLRWLHQGSQGSVKPQLEDDVVYSIHGTAGELWLGRRRGGLTCLRRTGGNFTASTYTRSDGLAENTVYSVHRSRDGTVWAGTLTGGVSKLLNGQITTFTMADGLAANAVTSILETRDGAMWFATAAGISSLTAGRWRTYDAADGLPSTNVHCLFYDAQGILWAGTANGLAFLRSGRFHAAPEVPASLREQILGIAEDRFGSLWISTSDHVLRVSRDKVLSGAVGNDDLREYGIADGLRGLQGVKRHRSVAMDAQGRVWFSTNRGISVVDPHRIALSGAPAVVQIQGVFVDGNPVAAEGSVRIPADHQRITVRYAGLSLSVPERIRFRYQLGGFESKWSDPVAQREAVYTNLGPGGYTFRVVASNSDGVWNGAETSLRFEIEPAFWQTWWFRGSVALVCAACVIVLYRFRLHRLTEQLNVRFEERLAERTRVAQDLHDTLLQGFLSAWMQLHVLNDQLPAESANKPAMARIIDLVGRVIEEGRNAVAGLRSRGISPEQDLARAFSRIQQELGLPGQIAMRVAVEGQLWPVSTAVRDDIYRIGREAIVNAFRHSRGTTIDVELEYTPRYLRIAVRDDGCGIDAAALRSGREGHWGLPGMRERAERIGARLRLMSSGTTGTEVELVVPAYTAFEIEPGVHTVKWWRILLAKRPASRPMEETKAKDR